MSWDHTVSYIASDTWSYPSPPPRDNMVYIWAIGGGGKGGAGARIGSGFTYTHASGGGGEAGEIKEETVILSDENDVPIVVGPMTDTAFGSYFTAKKGNNGTDARYVGSGTGLMYGLGGSGNPGNDGSNGTRDTSSTSRSSGGSTGYTYGNGGYGGGSNDSGGGDGTTGRIYISWNDAGYTYVMEGE